MNKKNMIYFGIILSVLVFTISSSTMGGDFSSIQDISKINVPSEIVEINITEKDIVKLFIKTEDDKYGKISLIDSKDFSRIGAEYLLLRNSDTCNRNCYAEGEAILYMKTKIFDDLLFKDKNGKNINLDNVKVSVEKNVTKIRDIPVYGEVCNKTIGKEIKETCYIDIVGYTHEEYIEEDWVNVTDDILDAGFYKWRIDAKKEADEEVDWIIDFKGILFNEWAWWARQSSLDQYYSFDTPYTQGNNVQEGINWSNATNAGADMVAGKVNQAYDFVEGNTDWIDASKNMTDFTQGDFTLSFWFKSPGISGGEGHILYGNTGSTYFYIRMTATDKIRFYSNDGSGAHAFDSTNTFADDAWHMATVTSDGINYALFIDTDLEGSVNFDSTYAMNNIFVIGATTAYSAVYNGELDELMVRRENISVTTMIDDYNYGNGRGIDYYNETLDPENYPQLAGTVKDGDGNAVNGALIFALVNDTASAIVYNTTSNLSGGWVIDLVDAGNYTVCTYSPNNKTLRGDCTPFIEAI